MDKQLRALDEQIIELEEKACRGELTRKDLQQVGRQLRRMTRELKKQADKLGVLDEEKR